MPEPATMIALGAAAVGAASSIYGSITGNKAAKKTARNNAKSVFATRMEEIRRQQFENAQVEGVAVASAYASNLQGDQGSPGRYIQALKNENLRQISYSKYAAKKEAENIREGGQSPGALAGQIGTAASAISAGIGQYKTLEG